MSIQFSELALQVQADGQVTSDEIMALRRLGWGDGEIFREEAEAIFAINRAVETHGNEWVDFFVEAIAEFVLNGTEPRHMCSESEAAWLIEQIDADGQLESMAELETLVRIVERAHNVPATLKAYALERIEDAVLSGTGPTRCGGELSDTHISATECKLLRRLIFASGGDGPAAVSKTEAEMLFRLKDATMGHENAPEWKPLFVDGVSNHLTGFFHAKAQLDHSEALALESFIADNRVNVGRFMGAMMREIPRAHNSLGKVFGRKQDGSGFRARMVEGEAVTEAEADWLDAMIEADGMVDEFERALLDRIKQDD